MDLKMQRGNKQISMPQWRRHAKLTDAKQRSVCCLERRWMELVRIVQQTIEEGESFNCGVRERG